MTSATTPTLFERRGAAISIDVAVNAFYDRVFGDPDLEQFLDGVDAPRLRAHEAAYFARVYSGPARYRGRNLFAGHLAAVLAAFGVPADRIAGTIAAVDGLGNAVVGRARAGVSSCCGVA